MFESWTVQNLGYSAAAYDVAMTRLIRKYGGMRREIRPRQVPYCRVCEGNATDLEQFTELLDTLIVKLSESGQAKNGRLHEKLNFNFSQDIVIDGFVNYVP
ncbi:hypothetical protein QZH41_006975 [Actinostola sp. cb2023]|nr:hypothetical protein QZH41_006975 [Actinostola sp. cb2023]